MFNYYHHRFFCTRSTVLKPLFGVQERYHSTLFWRRRSEREFSLPEVKQIQGNVLGKEGKKKLLSYDILAEILLYNMTDVRKEWIRYVAKVTDYSQLSSLAVAFLGHGSAKLIPSVLPEVLVISTSLLPALPTSGHRILRKLTSTPCTELLSILEWSNKVAEGWNYSIQNKC